jgi:Rrf2 family nitric oxide-sensitive transcriptional repressor
VRFSEPDMALVPCFKPIEEDCAIAPCCGLRGALARANAAFLAVLDDYSLADLVKPRASMRALLGIEAVAPRRATAGAGR